MTALANMPHLALVVLAATFFLLASGQTVHALLVALRRGAAPAAVVAAYEGAIALHLVLACCGAVAAAQNYGAFHVRLRPFDLPLEPFLWIDLAAAAVGLVLAVAKRKPAMAPEIALLALCTPPVIEALGERCVYLFIADAAFFLFRTVAALVLDVRHFATSVSTLSIVDALDRLPEGIIWADGKRRILYMNDAMRARLTNLGFATDLSETASLWADLEACACRDGGAVLPEGIRIPMPSGQTCLFKRDVVRLRKTECRRMVAMDVTEEESLNAQIERANELLEAENVELRESMARVAEVSRDEAMVRMKARVHDTIGQRLSILHRFLEAENPTPEALDEVTKLAGSILDDLAEPESPDRAAQLASIVRAFSLVGISVRVTGELPDRPDVAEAFVNIIREAATNAAKHGQAKLVDVQIAQDGAACSLRIVNDGMPASADAREGSGIPGMRRAAAGVGATFAVTSRSPFSIEVVAPAAGAADACVEPARAPGCGDLATSPATPVAVPASAPGCASASVSAGRPATPVPVTPAKEPS